MSRELQPFFVINFSVFIFQLVASVYIFRCEAAEDTVLEIPKPHGQVGTTVIPVLKGVKVISYRISSHTSLTMSTGRD